jgi:hypothetical protein
MHGLEAEIVRSRAPGSTRRDARHRKGDCAAAAAFAANAARRAFDQRAGREPER